MGITIARITPEHGPQARTLIARAFANDPLINWLFPPTDMSLDQRLDAIAIFYWPDVEAYAAAGTGHVALDGNEVVGASMWSLPNTTRPASVLPSSTTVATILLGEKLKELASAMKAARATGRTPETPYLHDLAVDDGCRSSGIGAKLLEAGLDEYGTDGSWLETTNPRNHSFYERFGFNIDAQHRIADSDITMTRMVRGRTGFLPTN
ncbi:GNAT family N-acetyltransferase [Brevibacterium spongiae]|uniref:GNAT family N-acetyltransferase n=1 Tax=Brevibacterium spongiae TaxID=2909672 RepID=A0ABY5SKU3_9MICO|nr:GNAT family N-acetyltransferase [Brevibacterium spongiae]UVI35128.1 GNAT family N-acetyltransferase [Brevibacterium spongiae]